MVNPDTTEITIWDFARAGIYNGKRGDTTNVTKQLLLPLQYWKPGAFLYSIKINWS